MRLLLNSTISLLVVSVVSSASPSFAIPTGCTSPAPGERHYVGGYIAKSRTWGASAVIDTQKIDLCPGTPSVPNGSLHWVGVDNQSGGWVQIGWRRLSSQLSNHLYTEAYSNATGYADTTDWSTQPTNTNNYKVDLYWGGSNSSSIWDYYMNDSLIVSVPFDYLNISPYVMQVKNEVVNPGNQIVGTTSKRAYWADFTTKTTVTGSYLYEALNTFVDPGIASHTGTVMTNPAYSWSTWDTRY